jgi:molybdopterin/thiamine biosynthesis adenylyltransferase
LPPPDTIDPASLDRFIETLLDAGFEPTGDQRSWIGPIQPALSSMTDATTMRVVVRDGWPAIQPRIYVRGLPIGRHRNGEGDVCLWEIGDPSREWLTWDGVLARIEKWAAEAQGHPTVEDPGLDPHLTFDGATIGLATIDLTERPINDGEVAELRATRDGTSLRIGEGDAVGRWYARGRPESPPQNLDQLRAQLRRRQREDFDTALESVGRTGGISFAVFAWRTPVGPNLLILVLSRRPGGDVVARPYEAARTDYAVLRLRAGPDSTALADKTIAVFGVGAIGSHVVDLLGRSGVVRIMIFDRQTLRPGDVVRHLATSASVGQSKVDAVGLITWSHAPWTRVEGAGEQWSPTPLRATAGAADIVIDATGISSFTAQMSVICRQVERPLVSVALYRQGSVGRARFQSAGSGIVITDRPDDDRFPTIPAGVGEDTVSWEAGCADPIAQAPPTSVVGIAATTARLVIDILTGREGDDVDLLEVYRALEGTEFDKAGARRFPAE